MPRFGILQSITAVARPVCPPAPSRPTPRHLQHAPSLLFPLHTSNSASPDRTRAVLRRLHPLPETAAHARNRRRPRRTGTTHATQTATSSTSMPAHNKASKKARPSRSSARAATSKAFTEQKHGFLGTYVQEIGQLQVFKVRENTSAAQITFTCDTALLGDLLAPVPDRESPLRARRRQSRSFSPIRPENRPAV